MEEISPSSISLTPFLNGKLKIFQPEKGYRFGIDSLLLAYFLRLKPGERVLEACAGCGVISLIALWRFPKSRIFALEFDKLLVRCLFLNAKENSFENRLFPLMGDVLKPPFRENFFDVVFLNPPYFKKGTGRESPYHFENLARREEAGFLPELINALKRVLKNRGRLYLVFTAYRLAELIFLLKNEKIEPKFLRLVHSYPGAEAKLVLIEGIKGGGEEVRILPPLYVYEKPSGDYSPEVKAWLKGDS